MAKSLLIKLVLSGIALAGMISVSGCNGRAYFGANDPELSYNQNRQITEQRIEDDKSWSIAPEPM